MKEVKVSEWGKRLPSNGQEFSFVPFFGKREKDVYKMLSSLKPGITNQVRVTLAVLLNKVGGVTLTPHSSEGALEIRLKEFDNLDITFGDAYYMYLIARMESFGKDLKLNLICPACKEKSTYTIDTSAFSVRVASSPGDLEKEVTLDTPIDFNGTLVNKVIVTAMRFNGDFYNFENPNEVQSATVALNTKFVGYDFPVGQEQIEDLLISVQRKLYSAVDEVTPGITEALDFLCPKCSRTSPYLINWEYPSFFA